MSQRKLEERLRYNDPHPVKEIVDAIGDKVHVDIAFNWNSFLGFSSISCIEHIVQIDGDERKQGDRMPHSQSDRVGIRRIDRLAATCIRFAEILRVF